MARQARCKLPLVSVLLPSVTRGGRGGGKLRPGRARQAVVLAGRRGAGSGYLGDHVRGLTDMETDRPESGLGEDRRGLLRKMLVLGAAAPLAGASFGARTAMAGQRPAVRRSRVPAGLSSRQMAGQRVVFSYSGLTVPPALLALITAGEAAGVIFYGDNISGAAQIAAVIGQLGKAQRQSPVPAPLLLMTDQEGGEVRG